MDEKVTLIVPTYTRLYGLKRLVASVRKNTRHPYQFLIVVDGGNKETYDWCIAQGLEAVLCSEHRWYVAQMNLGAYICQTELFCYLNDDMVAEQRGWLGKAVRTFRQQFPDGVGLLKLDDCHQPKDGVSACGLASKALIRTIYRTSFLWPEYKHYASDKELTEITKMMGCFLPTDIKMRHVRDLSEPIYKASERQWWGRDQRLYRQRKQIGFPR